MTGGDAGNRTAPTAERPGVNLKDPDSEVDAMKKLLLILGVILLAACVLSLLFAAWNRFAYFHVLDGSGELYLRLHRRMIVSFAVGLVLALLWAACLIVRGKT